MLIKNGVVNPALSRLVVMQGLVVGSDPDPLTPRALNEVLQEHWVKAKDGTFRSQLGGRFPTEPELVLLRELGAAVIPIDFNVQYKGTLVLGATLKAVVRRMHFMKKEEDRADACIPEQVFLLGSTRLLDPKQEMPEHVPAILEETKAAFSDLWQQVARDDGWPKIEIDMMAFAELCLDVSWGGVKICAPDVPSVDCAPRPANTTETIKEWLKGSLVSPGHYLVVSSQPFCEGQKMAVERAVKETGKEGYTFDVCGPEAPPLPLSRWLDNLAKQLWEEVQLL